MAEWRPIEHYEGFYEISDTGLVRSVDRTIEYVNGKVVRYKSKPIHQQADKKGRLKVELCKRGTQKTHSVPMLVAKAFIGSKPAEGYEVCHGPTGNSDNSVGNLRWCTSSENTLDSVKDGTHYAANRTECPYGHPYIEINLVKGDLARGRRTCRVCELSKPYLKRNQHMTKQEVHKTYEVKVFGKELNEL